MKARKSFFFFFAIALLLSGCSVDPAVRERMEKSGKGDELFAAGDADGAVRLWKEALDYGKSAELYEKIVTAQIVKNDLEQAEKWTCEGLTCFPNNVNLLFDYALVKFRNKDFTDALDSLDKVLESNGYYPNAHFLKGMIYEEKGDKASARKEFVYELNNNPGSKGAWQKLRGLTND